MYTAGQAVVIAEGMWVHSQSPSQLVMDRWTKVMVLRPVHVQIEAIGDDGWLILVDKKSGIKYKAWPTVLENAES